MSTTSVSQTSSVAELIASLPESERAEVLSGLTEKQAGSILYDWRGIWARKNQLPPKSDWLFWLLLAGRGFGKTRTGAEQVKEWAEKPLPAPIHLVAPTTADIRKVLIEGSSGLLSCYPPEQRPMYEPSKGHKVTWANGNIALGFSADEPDRLRGPQCCRFWADELCAWRFMQAAWDNLMFGFRIGDDLRGVITTTPKPVKLLKEILAFPKTVATRASTYENRANLAQAFYDTVVRPYEGTRLGRQELLAEILDDVEGALWKWQQIEAGRIRPDQMRWDLLVRLVLAIDPAVTAGENSAETGIIAAGLTPNGHVIVCDDLSGRYGAAEWAQLAWNYFQAKRCDRIVGEINQGGDLVFRNVQAAAGAAAVPFRAVRATRGKMKRAEPVATLYERGLVHHLGAFPELETQMCNYVPGMEDQGQSPDRLDALVWAITELLVDPEPGVVQHKFGQGYQISSI